MLLLIFEIKRFEDKYNLFYYLHGHKWRSQHSNYSLHLQHQVTAIQLEQLFSVGDTPILEICMVQLLMSNVMYKVL